MTIHRHWLLAKEQEKVKWERMMGKVTLRRAEETCAQVLNTHKQADPHVTRGMGALSTGDTHTQQGCTQRTGMCTHNTHEGALPTQRHRILMNIHVHMERSSAALATGLVSTDSLI